MCVVLNKLIGDATLRKLDTVELKRNKRRQRLEMLIIGTLEVGDQFSQWKT